MNETRIEQISINKSNYLLADIKIQTIKIFS
jgi:hypothetical protein